MNWQRNSWIMAVLLLLQSSLTSAMPINNMQEVGRAKLEVLFWDVYWSTLYTPSGTFSDIQGPLALKIHYLRDIESDELVESTQEQWQKLSLSHPNQSTWLKKLGEMWPDLKEGDELILHIDEQQISHFYYNQEVIGQIDDEDFGHQFASIWLSKDASYPKIRNKLIGSAP